LPEGSGAAIGDVIAIIGSAGEDISALLAETPPPEQQPKPDDRVEAPPPEQQPKPDGLIKASPLARKMAAQHDLDLKQLQGSGPEGRIIKADIEQAIAAAKPGPAPAAETPEQAPAQAPVKPSEQAPSVTSQIGQDVATPVSGKRRIIAQRLSESMFSAPHYYLQITVEMDGIMAARSSLNAKADTKVSVNTFLIKFVAEALKKHPVVHDTWAGATIIRHSQADIGLAVALSDGLITPVVRDCGNKGMLQIEQELKPLIDKARSGTLKPEAYTGATFTISNLGSYGIESFTAIINPPGSAILAVGAIKREPVVQPDDSIQIRSVMKLTLSCDHRVIDGAAGAAFLADLKNMLEEPVRALY
jgi:pyruvate dehydrogenase E2 component (dihydrolipoamide acetyltransferase)